MLFSAALVALLPLLASAAPGIQRRATGVFIELERDQTQCLTVVQSQTGTFANGDAVTNRPCNGGRSGPQQWDISRGDGLIRVTGTNFCLDAGSNPSNNVPAKIWQCYPGLGNQQWYYTADNRIAITGGNQCLDQGPSGVQTYQCTTGNTNQAWVIAGGGLPPTSSSASVSSSASSSSSSAAPPTRTGVRIHPNGDNTRCLALTSRFPGAGAGTLVGIADCATIGYENLIRWEINRGNGQVRLAGYNFCLDAGSVPRDGELAKIWTCIDGNRAQQWYYTNDNRIALTGGTQCLDKQAESQSVAQTWTCTTGNNNQVWTTTS